MQILNLIAILNSLHTTAAHCLRANKTLHKRRFTALMSSDNRNCEKPAIVKSAVNLFRSKLKWDDSIFHLSAVADIVKVSESGERVSVDVFKPKPNPVLN
jgi:hypothetical protein